MPTPHPLAITVAVCALAVPLTAASSAHATPPEPTTPVAASAPATNAPATSATVSWQRCKSAALRFSAIRCATVLAPLDHSDPEGRTIRLAVSRLKHTSSAKKYRGVILLNPGGPGGAGLTMSAIGQEFPKKVRARYDWIGFDPRGVGASRPRVSCDPDYFGFNRPDYIPRPAAVLDAWLERSEQYALDCAKNGDILRHMRTTDSVADMEVIRTALGAEQINYFGFSYGTYLGQVYATAHPDRVDRMILDSNIDPSRVFYQSNLDQDVAMQKNLDRWFAWIAKRDRRFDLGATEKAVTKKYNRTERSLAARPARGKIGAAEWADIFNTVVYAKSEWFSLAAVFANYVNRGDARELVRTYRRSGSFGDDNTFAVYSAVQCTDAPWPVEWSTWSADNWRVYRKAPNITWMNAWFNAQCRTWPVPPGPRFPVDGSDAPALLLVGGTYDGATPFAGSLAVRRLFPRASLVEIVKDPTHADSLGNACARGYVSRFLGSGALPPRQPGNRADVRCPLRGQGRGLG